MRYCYTYIEHLDLYRIWDPQHPEQTVAYLDAKDLALVLLEDPEGDVYEEDPEETEETRRFMDQLRRRDRTAMCYRGLSYIGKGGD